MDARFRIFLYTLASQYQNQSFSARDFRDSFEMSGYESDTCGRSYTIRIRYVWTQIFLYPHEKKLRIQKSPDTCGRGLIQPILAMSKYGHSALNIRRAYSTAPISEKDNC